MRDDNAALEVEELWNLGQRDVEVKQMIQRVTVAEKLDIGSLRIQKPDVFAALYDQCYMMIAELGEDNVGQWQ